MSEVREAKLRIANATFLFIGQSMSLWTVVSFESRFDRLKRLGGRLVRVVIRAGGASFLMFRRGFSVLANMIFSQPHRAGMKQIEQQTTRGVDRSQMASTTMKTLTYNIPALLKQIASFEKIG
jgi:hypothetical protein